MNSRKGFIGRVFALVLCLVLLAMPVMAQNNVLTYGGGASGSVDATAPFGFYSFTGNADDVVSIQVLSLTSGLQPTVALNAPNQQQLAFNAGDPFNPGTARITFQLTQTGTYSVLVSGNGGTGEYAIRLDGSPAPEAIDVSDDETIESALNADIATQVYSVDADPDAPTTVTISSTTDSFEFVAMVRDSSGQMIATLLGSDAQPIIATLPQGNETYDIEVRPTVVGSEGNIQLMIGLFVLPDATATPDDETPDEEATVPPPATTEEVDGACTVANTGTNPINIRAGAGTDFEIVGSLLSNTERTVLGVDSETGWYLIALVNGGEGWVFGNLVTLSGDCTQVQEADTDEAVVPVQATPTYTATTEQQENQPTATQAQQQQQATATFTPSYTPTQQATATYTPSYTPTTQPAAQVAPEDARFNNPLNIALDSTTSVLDFVSYPGGDTEDRVRWDITGMNQNASISGGRARLVISVTCFGQNTADVQFFTGGNTYSCGQTIVDTEVTFNSKTGSVVITAVGGEGTYVQWVLTGTATRVN